MTLKGRYWTLLWLTLFLGVAFVVVGRQNAALSTARHLEGVRERRLTLDQQRAELEQRIFQAASLAVLAPRAERELGLQRAGDQHTTILRLQPAPGAER